MKKVILVLILTFNIGIFCNESSLIELKTGDYSLKINSAQMPKDKNNIELPATIEKIKDEYIVKTQGMKGNKIQLNVKIIENKILMSITEFEKSSIVSFHYIGEITKENIKGDFYAFIDSKSALSGTWELIKK